MTILRLPDQLPGLSGNALFAFRIAWIIAFGLSMLSLVDFAQTESIERQLSRDMTALGIAQAGPGSFRSIRAREPDRDYDIRDGDMLLAINNHPISTVGSAVAAMDGPDGDQVSLTLQSESDAQPRYVEVTRDNAAIEQRYAGTGLSFDQYHNLELAISLALRAAYILVSLILFLRRAQDLVAAMISFGAMMTTVGPIQFLPMIPTVALDALGFFAIGFLVLGLLFFPGPRIAPRWSLLGLPLTFVCWLIILVMIFEGGSRFPYQPMLVAMCLAFVLVAMIARYRNFADDTARQQIKFVLLGVASIFALFLPMMLWFQLEIGGIIQPDPWSTLIRDMILGISRLALPVGILIALLRYRLFDADRVISRSVAYALMTLVIGIAFFAMERLIDFVGNQLIGGGIGAASFGIAAALAAVLLNPLHAWLVRWSERRFQRKLVDLREELPEAARDMRQISSMDDLLGDFLARIQPAVHARSVAIISADREVVNAASGVANEEVSAWATAFDPNPSKTGLDLDRTNLQFPLRLELKSTSGADAGWLLLGPRLDGSFYNRDERSTIAGLSDPMARAVATVAKREQREAEVDREFGAVNREIEGVKRLLEKLDATLQAFSRNLSDQKPDKLN